jgi:hypothetical protein
MDPQGELSLSLSPPLSPFPLPSLRPCPATVHALAPRAPARRWHTPCGPTPLPSGRAPRRRPRASPRPCTPPAAPRPYPIAPRPASVTLRAPGARGVFPRARHLYFGLINFKFSLVDVLRRVLRRVTVYFKFTFINELRRALSRAMIHLHFGIFKCVASRV